MDSKRTYYNTTIGTGLPVPGLGATVPYILSAAGDDAILRFVEFFTANIRNRNTRRAYLHNARRFLAWAEAQGIASLQRISPVLVASYVELLQDTHSKPTVKQHLASIRMLFDWLVTGQIVPSNPAHSVRGPRHVVTKGKTPVLSTEEMRALLQGIPTEMTNKDGYRVSDVVGLRDRALIAAMFFSFARVGAVVGMNVNDYFPQGKRYWLRLSEKGGKQHVMPAHHTLEEYLDDYIQAAGIADDAKGPMFRTAPGKAGLLTRNPMQTVDVWRMIRRRSAEVGIRTPISCHSFRATGITNYLEHTGALEKAQQMAAHASPRTTKLYDRTSDQVSLDEVEKITL